MLSIAVFRLRRLATPLCLPVVLATFVPLVGCGGNGGSSTTPAPTTTWQGQALVDPAFADRYFVADPSCQANNVSASALGSISVARWAGGVSSEVSVNFQSDSTAPTLHGPGINSSLYGLVQATPCGPQADKASCGAAVVSSDAQALDICKPAGPYARTSVEGVGLTSIASLSNAANFYATLNGSAASIEAAMLLVLPSIATTYTDASPTVVTDNLAYAPAFREQPTFVIYPKGAAAVQAGLWQDVNFWEIPWTLAHEFGHHVFRTHSGITSETSGLAGSPPFHSFQVNDMDESGAVPAGLQLIGGTRSVSNDDLLAAINEGFADLYAYYVSGNSPGMTKDFQCFQDSRDPGSATFADGQKKSLSTSIVSTFMSASISPMPVSCSSPYFQDIHMIGAIFAYGVDQIFAASTGTTTGIAAAGAKAALLLKWAGALGTVFTPYENNQNPGGLTLEPLARSALTVVASGSTNLPKAVCTAAKAAFPVYATVWFPGVFACI